MGKVDLGARILSLLEDDRVAIRCAAALVLGAAGKGSAPVASALARMLHDPDATARRFALEGLEALGARGLAAELVPLLGDPHLDEDVRARALRVIASEGSAAEKILARALGAESSDAARRAIATLLVKLGTAGALDALLVALGDPESGEAILQLLRTSLDEHPRPIGARVERAIADVEKGLTKHRGEARRGSADEGRSPLNDDPILTRRLANLLRLLGYLADPSSLSSLCRHAGAQLAVAVRVAAIAAMRRILAGEVTPKTNKKTEEAIVLLIAAADDADPLIARAAVDTLRGAKIPPELAKKFASLSAAKNPDARKLALERLPALGTRAAIPKLISALAGADQGPRDAAARALSTAPEAAGPLVEALIEAADPDVTRRLLGAVRVIAKHVPPKMVEALAKAVAASPNAPLLDALAWVAPDRHAAVLFERAAKLRKDERFGDAFRSLRPLLSSGAKLDDEQRFFIATLGLKVGGKDLLRAARTVDPVLLQFRQLASGGFPVAQKLGKQKDLSADDLFTLGFNLVEARGDEGEDDRELGRELLQAVIDRSPRGKLAVAARNKLKLAR